MGRAPAGPPKAGSRLQTSGPPSPGPSQATGAKVEVAQAAGQCDRAGSEPALPAAWAPQPPRLPTASSRTAGGRSPGRRPRIPAAPFGKACVLCISSLWKRGARSARRRGACGFAWVTSDAPLSDARRYAGPRFLNAMPHFNSEDKKRVKKIFFRKQM